MQIKRQNTDINAIMISIILHIILFGLLVLGSLYHKVEIMGGGEGDGEIIDVVMVDTGSAAQEWGRLQQQKKGQVEQQKTQDVLLEQQQEIERQKELERQKQLELEKQKEADRLKELAEKKKAEDKAKQDALEKQRELEAKAKEAAEAAKLKAEAEAKRLAALAKQAEEESKAKAEKAKAEAEAKAKAEKAKAEAEAKAKAEKAKAEAEAKAKAEKAKAEAEAKAKAEKAKAEAEAKAKADAQRKAEQAALDNFLNGGDIGGGSAVIGGNTNRQGLQGSGAARGAGDGGKTGDQYAGVIKKEIQRRFLKEPSFANKVCVVEVEFLRDGTIANYRRVSGPDDICNAALSAVARTKKVPPAPTDEIYNKYKKVPVDFKLR
ncbi:cell envelope integrity protein TolA [Pasteurella canis]|uniref:cell envelope integrity protein TolA n=1 Tax=Pasteurella canis TaxID=753 RepID=UPI000D8915E4|nr:cell envelope integrity protein TolA [Pasteurella canis]SPY33579.1 protein TolA [Pasteurella canis]